MLKSLFSSSWKKDPSEFRAFLMKLFLLLAFILGIWLVYSILHIVIALVFSAFLVMLFSPFLNWGNRHHIPDWLGIIIVYLAILGLILLIFFSILPIFIDQILSIFHDVSSWFDALEKAYNLHGVEWLGLPTILGNLIQHLDLNDIFSLLRNNFWSISEFATTNLKNIANQWVGLVSGIGTVLISIATTFVFAFFMTLERKRIRLFFYEIIPASVSRYLQKREDGIIHTLSSWMRGQIILSLSMSLLVYVGLWILHAFGIVIENKATLAMLAGLLESIPYFWPFLALLPALALAGSVSWIAILAVLILYIVLQQLEGQVLVPVIMSKSLNLSPFFVLVMMAIGASVANVLGILLAVPVAAIIEIGVTDFLEYKKNHS